MRIRNHRYPVLRARLAERDTRFCFRFLFLKILELAGGSVFYFFPAKNRVAGHGAEAQRIIQASVLGAWSPSLLWGESITAPFGFLGAIAVQSTVHQFRMLLAKTAPFVRVDVCIVRLPASTLL